MNVIHIFEKEKYKNIVLFILLIWPLSYIIYFSTNFFGFSTRYLEIATNQSSILSHLISLSCNFLVIILFSFFFKNFIKNDLVYNLKKFKIAHHFLVSLIILLISFYYFSNVSIAGSFDRSTTKQLSNVLLSNITYIAMAIESFFILRELRRPFIYKSIFIILFLAITSTEREPFLFILFPVFIRLITSKFVQIENKIIPLKKSKKDTYIKIIFLAVITFIIFYLAKFFFVDVFYRDFSASGYTATGDNLFDWIGEFNPLGKITGELSQKVSLETAYFSGLHPDYLNYRIFVPMQFDRIFMGDAFTNSWLARDFYTLSGSAPGFSIILDFFLSLNLLGLILYPLFLVFVSKLSLDFFRDPTFIILSLNYLFKLQRSEFWPVIIPFLLSLSIFLITYFSNKTK